MVNMQHPAVQRVQEALAAHGIEPEVRWFDEATTTAQAAAEALGIEVGAIANSLVFALDGEPVLVLTSGAHRVDTDWLGRELGGTLSRAPKELVKEATGQVIGGVAPIGHPAPVRTFVDTALAQYPQVWAAAGHAHTVFPTTFDELLRITGGTATAVEPSAA
jgi:prolyl-tRNA editing enzyme YbaK/EbsC (Cys-tRNA(Pro) deacylase)